MVNLVDTCDMYDADGTALLFPKSYLEIPTFEPCRQADGMPWPGRGPRRDTHMQLLVHPE